LVHFNGYCLFASSSTYQVLGVLTRDGFLHLFSTDAEDLASHADLVTAVFSAAATGPRGNAAVSNEAGDASSGTALPPPALSPALITLAASLANNVADMEAAAAAGTVQPIALARRCSTPPGITVQIGPTTALAFLPNVHPHAWEIGGERGSWFSGGRQVLRAGSVEEAAEWVVACTQMQDALAPVVVGGTAPTTGGAVSAAAPPSATSAPPPKPDDVAAEPHPVALQPPVAAAVSASTVAVDATTSAAPASVAPVPVVEEADVEPAPALAASESTVSEETCPEAASV
jgi:hypothetical protein